MYDTRELDRRFVASLAFVALMVIIWRATHDLDFQWKPQDIRLKVKTVKKPIPWAPARPMMLGGLPCQAFPTSSPGRGGIAPGLLEPGTNHPPVLLARNSP